MRKRNLRLMWAALAVTLVMGLVLLAGCSDSDESFTKPADLTGSCESCHQDRELLVATADPVEDEGGESSGEG